MPQETFTLDPATIQSAISKAAGRARQLATRSTCEEQDAALGVVAFQLNAAHRHLDRDDISQARTALTTASSYANSEEANTPLLTGVPQLAQTVRDFLAALPA
ncbi:hypothetical protein [Streptomyces sp. NPDC059787]|uniref:hypothetical protein n=1 Tax=Streptomyces sp. NPDC059787 TaxID=3346947 RepID=UPI00365E64AC